jgi:hypothetical protein
LPPISVSFFFLSFVPLISFFPCSLNFAHCSFTNGGTFQAHQPNPHPHP